MTPARSCRSRKIDTSPKKIPKKQAKTRGRTCNACILALVCCRWHDPIHHLVRLAGQLVGQAGTARQSRRSTGRAQVGRRPRGVEQPCTEVVVVPVFHHRVLERGLPDRLPRAGQFQRCTRLVADRTVRGRATGCSRSFRTDLRAFRRDGLRSTRIGSRRAKARRQPVRELLHDLPRLRRARCARLPEPDGRRLAVGGNRTAADDDDRHGSERHHAGTRCITRRR